MRDLFQRLAWPQVVALCAIIGGTVGFFALVPPGTLQMIAAWDWAAIVSGTLAVLGAIGGTLGGPLVKPRSTASTLPPLPEIATDPASPRALARSERPPAERSE